MGSLCGTADWLSVWSWKKNEGARESLLGVLKQFSAVPKLCKTTQLALMSHSVKNKDSVCRYKTGNAHTCWRLDGACETLVV